MGHRQRPRLAGRRSSTRGSERSGAEGRQLWLAILLWRSRSGSLPSKDYDCSKTIAPKVLMQAHSAPLGLLFYDGNMFPAGLSRKFVCDFSRIVEPQNAYRIQSCPHKVQRQRRATGTTGRFHQRMDSSRGKEERCLDGKAGWAFGRLRWSAICQRRFSGSGVSRDVGEVKTMAHLNSRRGGCPHPPGRAKPGLVAWRLRQQCNWRALTERHNRRALLAHPDGDVWVYVALDRRGCPVYADGELTGPYNTSRTVRR